MLSKQLQERCEGLCELCNTNSAEIEYTVSPKEDKPENQVALCSTCKQHMEGMTDAGYWRVLEGSIWNEQAAVQALSYRLLCQLQDTQDWAKETMESVSLDESTQQWAMEAFKVADKHVDAFGVELLAGDNVVLTQNLNVKGTSFSAPKGTVVKKIRLVQDNTEQIEGKINEQVIVILTKYVRKSN